MRDLIVERIGRALHLTFDEFVREPLPERWIDLICRLNAEEDDTERESANPKSKAH
jgi:hypothetical protein